MSDVSAAFDRVHRDRLLRKLAARGVPDDLLQLFGSWLDARWAEVVVGGTRSGQLLLENMVFQGTVWGPPLWNLHYSSARHSVNSVGFVEVAYADDMNMSKAFAGTTSSESTCSLR